MRISRRLLSAQVYACVLTGALVAGTAGTVNAQAGGPDRTVRNDGWRVTAYPIYIWVPLGLESSVDLPPVDGGGGGGGGGGGDIVDGRFDGAFLAGFSVSNGTWRVDGDGLWAAVGGDRPERPALTVDLDVIYGHVSGGRAIYKDLYVSAGVRRYALKYDVKLEDRPNFSRKPGLWDPLVGLGWHHEGETLEVHATLEGGGFGVGADVDASGAIRADWKPLRHFGLTAGYTFLYFKASDDVAGKTFSFEQTLHGPILGIGLYF